MAGLTWIHLSDWHQGVKEFNRKVILDALIDDLKKRNDISKDLSKIDFIVFSGDVAYSGKPEEYEAAKEDFFPRLLEAAELGSDRLFIVPGNHDLNMDDLKLLPLALLEPLKTEQEIQDWIVEERHRKLALQPFYGFANFVSDYTNKNNSDFANIGRIVIEGKKIALLGLNSAWMCGRHKDATGKIDDDGYVLVGEPQIHQPLRDILDSDIKIAILHHPFNWLSDFDCRHIKERLTNECDFILNGHQHKPEARQISKKNGFYMHISTGTSYLDRIPKDPIFISAYNLVHLDLETKEGVVFLRRWSDRQNKWLEDIDTYASNGRCAFSLSTTSKSQVESKTPKASIGRIDKQEISIMIGKLDQLEIDQSLSLLESILKNYDIRDLNAYFDKLESSECLFLMENERYSRAFSNYLLNILFDYEGLDSDILFRVMKNFLLNFDYFERNIGSLPNERAISKLNILIEALTFEFQMSPFSDSSIFLVNLMLKTLNLYSSIDFHSTVTMKDIMLYYINTINKILKLLNVKLIFYKYRDINHYMRSEFHFCLGLFHSILELILCSQIFILEFKDDKMILELNLILSKIREKLDFISEEYKVKADSTGDERIIGWDVLSHINPLRANITKITKELI